MYACFLHLVILFVVGLVFAASLHFYLRLYDYNDPQRVFIDFLQRVSVIDISSLATRQRD